MDAQRFPLVTAPKPESSVGWSHLTSGIHSFWQIADIKTALLSAPALGLPDITKPFLLYVDEKQGVAKGMLMQHLGPWKRPVAYLSTHLDPVASGWPPCLREIAAGALTVKDADKLTLGQELQITAPTPSRAS